MTDEEMIPKSVANLQSEVAGIRIEMKFANEALVRIERKLEDGTDHFDEIEGRIECLEMDKKALKLGWKALVAIITVAAGLSAAIDKIWSSLATLILPK